MESAFKTAELLTPGHQQHDGASPPRTRPDITLVPPLAPAVKAGQLLQEAKKLSLEHVRSLQSAIGTVRSLSEALVEADELYSPGLHDFARRLAEDLFWRSKTLEVLAQKQALST
jgi:hypothetical protein